MCDSMCTRNGALRSTSSEAIGRRSGLLASDFLHCWSQCKPPKRSLTASTISPSSLR